VRGRRVVITGLGVVTPVGIGIDAYWKNIKSGKSGVGRISSFDASRLPVPIAAEVKDSEFDPRTHIKNRKLLKLLSRSAVFAMAAANMAVEDSNLPLRDLDPGRMGVHLGVLYGNHTVWDNVNHLLECESETMPGTFDSTKYYARFVEHSNPVDNLKALTNLPACHLAIVHNARGPVNTFVANATAGTQAIGSAYQAIERGCSDMMIAGGAEAAITPQSLIDYFLFLTMATNHQDVPEKACRPFDAQRSGMVLGEGAAIMILESLEHALKRNAKIYGEVLGYGCAAGNLHFGERGKDGSIALSMEKAMTEADLKAPDLDYINGNGDSTPWGDKSETLAIKKVFGEIAYKIPISSTKSMTGHLSSASGAVELITSLLAMREGIIPPTINYEHPDPDCDLDYVPNQARQSRVETVLSNSIGWFGESASLIVGKFMG